MVADEKRLFNGVRGLLNYLNAESIRLHIPYVSVPVEDVVMALLPKHRRNPKVNAALTRMGVPPGLEKGLKMLAQRHSWHVDDISNSGDRVTFFHGPFCLSADAMLGEANARKAAAILEARSRGRSARARAL